jgi:hypothetical protein
MAMAHMAWLPLAIGIGRADGNGGWQWQCQWYVGNAEARKQEINKIPFNYLFGNKRQKRYFPLPILIYTN